MTLSLSGYFIASAVLVNFLKVTYSSYTLHPPGIRL